MILWPRINGILKIFLLVTHIVQVVHCIFRVTKTENIDLERNFIDIRTRCNSIPGLTREQIKLCYQATDVTTIALDGLDLAINECQYQFQSYRWNCSSLSKKSRNPHSSTLLKRGYRESAFAYAISSAGVAYTVARACSQGRVLSCSCDPAYHPKRNLNAEEILRQGGGEDVGDGVPFTADQLNMQPRTSITPRRGPNSWKWGGCSHNLKYGIEFSKQFLDARETGTDIQSQINRHNNQAGRRAVLRNMIFRCKCHGVSGTCALKTCWKSAPPFHVIGNILKRQFKRAILVDQTNNNGPPLLLRKQTKRRNSRRQKSTMNRSPRGTDRGGGGGETIQNALLYYQKSPNFCDQDLSSDIPGTSGRRCNRTSFGTDSCDSMCCGRGYNLMYDHRSTPCRCQFKWCCHVQCDQCDSEEWISVCN